MLKREKFFVFLLAVALLFAFAGCSYSSDDDDDSGDFGTYKNGAFSGGDTMTSRIPMPICRILPRKFLREWLLLKAALLWGGK
ncbi:hypothetical protein [Treponema sp.]|uniref:hypothetical protein n=1 Tax=Treponema sp. TaxID=166 RepID=UPI003EFF7265